MDWKTFLLSFIVFLAPYFATLTIFASLYTNIGNIDVLAEYIILEAFMLIIGFYLALRVHGIKKLNKQKFIVSSVVLVLAIDLYSYLCNGPISNQLIIPIALAIDLFLFYISLRIYGVGKERLEHINFSWTAKLIIALIVGTVISYFLNVPESVIINGMGVAIGGLGAGIVLNSTKENNSVIGICTGFIHAFTLVFDLDVYFKATMSATYLAYNFSAIQLTLYVIFLISMLEGGFGGFMAFYIRKLYEDRIALGRRR